ncbi:hypothetical protein SLEP1_g18390 [Rubroshorea leprosula]|uniref:Uncharacterized protein n=1 Tax=Rubroshorea leprosula TaxID=152421 RepID=A0AAV5J6D1_9ROSI|nr:hypothetical protein SLEP1_g18390 [Rubroshorea leprosula]
MTATGREAMHEEEEEENWTWFSEKDTLAKFPPSASTGNIDLCGGPLPPYNLNIHSPDPYVPLLYPLHRPLFLFSIPAVAEDSANVAVKPPVVPCAIATEAEVLGKDSLRR